VASRGCGSGRAPRRGADAPTAGRTATPRARRRQRTSQRWRPLLSLPWSSKRFPDANRVPSANRVPGAAGPAASAARPLHRGGQLRRTTLAQRVDGAVHVARLSVLPELALAFQAQDLDFDADDPLQHRIDEIDRGVGHPPRIRLRRLVPARQPGDHAAHEALVVDAAQPAVRMHDLVVPGRHVAVRLPLARVPVGRDVALRATEHDHRLVALCDLLQQRILARHVGEQRTEAAASGIELEGQVVRIEPAGTTGDEHAERVLPNDAVQLVEAGFGEGFRQVHVPRLRQSNGFGRGVSSLEGGRIGRMNVGCSPVSVFRNATMSAFSCSVKCRPSCSRPITSTASDSVFAAPSWKYGYVSSTLRSVGTLKLIRSISFPVTALRPSTGLVASYGCTTPIFWKEFPPSATPLWQATQPLVLKRSQPLLSWSVSASALPSSHWSKRELGVTSVFSNSAIAAVTSLMTISSLPNTCRNSRR